MLHFSRLFKTKNRDPLTEELPLNEVTPEETAVAPSTAVASDEAFGKLVLDNKYEDRGPHHQNAIDLISGWTGAFPEHMGLSAGGMHLYSDPRLHWALEHYGSVEGKTVLELGPLEGSHSCQLEREGAAEVLAIEANRQAYLRCLIAKEIHSLKRCSFLLGDFPTYLDETDRRFDIVLASGVLYHMKDPVQVLDRITSLADSVFLWTHYFDGEILHLEDPRRQAFAPEPEMFEHKGETYRLHKRSYHHSWKNDSFCGGPDDAHFWMEYDDIIRICNKNGFKDIRTSFQETDGANGPSCMFFMRK